MKRWGTITLMLFAFVSGLASTYNCGGGSTSNAQDYAPLVHTHNASDITGGVLDVSVIPDHSHPASLSTQYMSISFLGATDAWPWGPTGKVNNLWDPVYSEYDQFANADTSVQWLGRSAAYAASAGQSCPVYVPVHLPHGAEVVEFGLLYYDETDGVPALSAFLQRTLGDPKGMRLVTVNSAGPSALPQYTWSTSVDPGRAVIDNTQYSYHIRGNLWGQEDMVLLSAFVGYKMP